VNALRAKDRNDVISRDYHLLVADLAALTPGRAAPVVLLNANVCELLEPKLKQDGFNVLNAGSLVYFPANGHQATFRKQFGEILNRL